MSLEKRETGSINPLLIPLILSVVFFFSALGFGVWAYTERQKYKEDTDQIVASEVAVAVERTKSEKDNEFIEREKEPLKEYSGPSDLGSILFKYPKTWSTYEDVSDGGANIIFHPHRVNASESTIYALRISVVAGGYDNVVSEYRGQIEEGSAKARTYKLPKVPSEVGIRIDGQLEEGKNGSIVIIPLRDKTIKIATESKDFIKDFDKLILPSFQFKP